MQFNWKQRLISQSSLTDVRDKLKKQGKTIVYTAGAWDMLHVGQIRYLHEASKLGDVLMVGVSSNEAVRKVKGPNRPILDEKIRAEMLIYVRFVDLVTILPEPSTQPTLALLQPDIYVTVKENWNEDYQDSKEYQTVIKYGGKVELVDRQSPYISTTQILRRSVSAELNDTFKDLMKLSKKPLKEKSE